MSVLQKTLDHILESWLPTKLSILIAGSTILLSLLAIGLPECLHRINIQLTADKMLLLRISVPITLLFLGTFTVLLLVIHHYKSIKSILPDSTKYAKQQVERWRTEIQSFSHQGGSFNTYNFMQSVTYSEMFPFLSSATKNNINSNNITVTIGGRQHMVDTNILMALYAELDRIAAE